MLSFTRIQTALLLAAALLAPACAAEVTELSSLEGEDEAGLAIAALTSPATPRRRFIPVRFVQFSSVAIPTAELQEKINIANLLFAKTGIQLYLKASHSVFPTAFQSLQTCVGANCTVDTYTWPANLATSSAIASFNPSCTFTHPAQENEFEALKRAAAHCALDGELLVYVNDGVSIGGMYPWESRLIGMSRHHIDNNEYLPSGAPEGNFGVFAHEVGHYLGLSHVFPGASQGTFDPDYGFTNASVVNSHTNWNLFNPETGKQARLEDFWDLVYKPAEEAPVTASHVFFTSRADALQRLAPFSSIGALQPIQSATTGGHMCGVRDPACQRTDGTFHVAGTLKMTIGVPGGRQETHFSDSALKGLSFPTPPGGVLPPGINVMSYGYATGTPLSLWGNSISQSQVEQVLRSLRFDIKSRLPVADGGYGHRQLLGDIWVRSWEGFEMQVGIDLAGNDYASFDMAEPIPATCRNACLQERDCRAYTYVAPRGSNPAKCWLKSAVGSRSVCTDCISGDTQGLEVGYDRLGSDYLSVALPAALPELCQARCGSETSCLAYTYVKPGIQGPSAMCWLKSAVAGRAASVDATSGVKHSLRNINIWGIDYTNFAPSPATEQTCLNACARDGVCLAYTMVGAGASARCWLKSQVGELRAGAGMASGVKRGLDLNTSLYGTISSTTAPFSTGARGCQASCASTTGCKGFNFYRSTAGQDTCVRLSSVTSSGASVGTTSGLNGVEFF